MRVSRGVSGWESAGRRCDPNLLVVCRQLLPDAGTDERDAVLGDLAESGVTGGKALRDLIGLVVRRQAGLWKDWRPWLALVGIVCLVDWRLSLFSLRLGNNLAMQCLTCWRFGTRFEDGLTVSQDIVAYACQCLALIFWSWTAGFVLGSLSRRTIRVSAPIACLIWLFCRWGHTSDVSLAT